MSDEGTKLQELTIDGLSKDLMFNDMNLADRFSRNALFLNKLCIGNIRQTRPETRQAFAAMVLTMLSGQTVPSKLCLYNLGFEASEGEAILEQLLES